MKVKSFLCTAATAVLLPVTAYAQGPLIPEGPPAPMMRTLDQIEPRRSLSNEGGSIEITHGGSYYLENRVIVTNGNGIAVLADHVTIDLNGFTIVSFAEPAQGAGILLEGDRRHVHIMNGHIKGQVTLSNDVFSGAGFLSGIDFNGADPHNVRVSGVSVTGCLEDGIDVGETESIAESCTVGTVGGTGIEAVSVSDSVALNCGATAIRGEQVFNSRGESVSTGFGVSAFTAMNCIGRAEQESGINAATAINCYGESELSDGIWCSNAQNCNGWAKASARGLHILETASNCRGTNTGIGNPGIGLEARTAVNCVGTSSLGDGLVAEVVNGCYGLSGGTGYGIKATELATGSYGESNTGTGLYAGFTAMGCRGKSIAGRGLSAGTNVNDGAIAIGCYGSSTTGLGLLANRANTCNGFSVSGTPRTITWRYNMP